MDYGMVPPEPPMPPRPPTAGGRDAVAVALGNASLLGVGYLMLRRWLLAAVTEAVTVILLVLLATTFRAVWLEIVVLVWWVALIGHGWFLAAGRTHRVALLGQRLIALSAAVPVLVAFGLLRFDASGIEGDVADARHSGDCRQALHAQERVWLGPRVADSPLTARGDRTVRACHRLQQAAKDFDHALADGRVAPLKSGYAGLTSVLARYPGHEEMVDTTLRGFLDGLPTSDDCDTVAITDWLRELKPSHGLRDRSADVAARTAPAALVGCADTDMDNDDWKTARSLYQQVLDLYPHDKHVDTAHGGVHKATLAIELDHVRTLLDDSYGDTPSYCDHPAKYSGAPAYGKGTNRALMYGNGSYTKKLPASWRTTDPTKAAVVVCEGDKKDGTTVQTCPYQSEKDNQIGDVAFHKIKIPVKVYELRTGKLVADKDVQISGSSCPARISWTSYSGLDYIGVPPDKYVSPSTGDIRSAFKPLIVR
jgi:hypothetical protein